MINPLAFTQSLRNYLTEIEPEIVGVKASDLCKRLGIQMVDINEES